MLMYEDIFNDHTLNIFTDASMGKVGNETIGCYGIIPIVNEALVILPEDRLGIARYSTNNDSELRGILKGVMTALQLRNSFETINLFSDSMISIKGLKFWINSWMKSIHNGVMHGSSGEVLNQELIKDIVFTILSNNLIINLYHQKGHVTGTKLDKAKQTFIDTNMLNCDVDMRLIETISKYNNDIDVETRNHLGFFISTQYVQEPKLGRAINFDLDRFNLKRYNELIGGNIR